MPKNNKKPKIKAKVVDYRSVNLAWLVDFKDRLFSKELAPGIELVVTQEHVGIGDTAKFELHKGDTLCVTGETATSYSVSRAYGDVRTGEVAKSSVASKPREEWSTEDVAEHVIKPAASPTSARKCRFADLANALEHFYTLKKADMAEQYVWLDIFSANQPKLTARDVEPAIRKENERQLTEGLHTAIANFEDRVMFMDKWDDATPLKRAWCVWELFGVSKAKKQLQIALPESEYDRYISVLLDRVNEIESVLSMVDASKAECHSQEDLGMIQKAIREQSSYAEINNIILSQLRLWVASTAENEILKEEAKKTPNASKVAALCGHAGLIYQALGQHRRAEPLQRKCFETYKKYYGEEIRETATSLNNLAMCLMDQGKYKEAKSSSVEALNLRRKFLAKDDPDIAVSLNTVAGVLSTEGKHAEAEVLYIEALAIRKKILGGHHIDVAESVNNLAICFMHQGKFEEAKPLHETALALRKKALGNNHPRVADSLNNLSAVCQAQGDYAQAGARMREALTIYQRVFGLEHPYVAMVLHNLAWLLMDENKKTEARKMGKEALRIALICHGKDHPTTQLFKQAWG